MMSPKNKLPKVSQKPKETLDPNLSAKKRLEVFFTDRPEFGNYGEQILDCLKFAEPSFQLLAEELTLDKLDRTKSLIGRHLFVSKLYPHPEGAGNIFSKEGKKTKDLKN
jgi:hypothetical protein